MKTRLILAIKAFYAILFQKIHIYSGNGIYSYNGYKDEILDCIDGIIYTIKDDIEKEALLLQAKEILKNESPPIF